MQQERRLSSLHKRRLLRQEAALREFRVRRSGDLTLESCTKVSFL